MNDFDAMSYAFLVLLVEAITSFKIRRDWNLPPDEFGRIGASVREIGAQYFQKDWSLGFGKIGVPPSKILDEIISQYIFF